MTYFVVSNRTQWTVASDRWRVPADEVPVLQDAWALLSHVQALADAQHQRVDEAVSQGYQDGFAQGVQEGLAQARQEASEALQQTVQALHAQAQTQHHGLQAAVVDLVCLIVRKLMGHWAPQDVVASLALQTLQSLDVDGPLVLRVHPDMVAPLQARLSAALTRRSCDVQGDGDLEPLGGQILTPSGRLLMGLDDQLATAMAALREVTLRNEPQALDGAPDAPQGAAARPAGAEPSGTSPGFVA